MKLCLLFLVLWYCLAGKAQDLLGAAGDTSAGELEYAMGEWAASLFPSCETGFIPYSNYNYILTGISAPPLPEAGIEILNHGDAQTLIITCHDKESTTRSRYVIYSPAGILYKNGIITQTPYTISYRTLPPGLYLLRIIRENGTRIGYEWIKN